MRRELFPLTITGWRIPLTEAVAEVCNMASSVVALSASQGRTMTDNAPVCIHEGFCAARHLAMM